MQQVKKTKRHLVLIILAGFLFVGGMSFSHKVFAYGGYGCTNYHDNKLNSNDMACFGIGLNAVKPTHIGYDSRMVPLFTAGSKLSMGWNMDFTFYTMDARSVTAKVSLFGQTKYYKFHATDSPGVINGSLINNYSLKPRVQADVTPSYVVTDDFDVPTIPGDYPVTVSLVVDGQSIDLKYNDMLVRVVVPWNGICGPSSGKTFTSIPTTDLCASGTPPGNASSVSETTNAYFWTCYGNWGGSDVDCSANRSCTSMGCSSASTFCSGTQYYDNCGNYCGVGTKSCATPSTTFDLTVNPGPHTRIKSVTSGGVPDSNIDCSSGRCSHAYPAGSEVVLQGSATLPSYIFDTGSTWTGCDSIVSSSNTCKITMSKEKEVTAQASCTETVVCDNRCRTEKCVGNCGQVSGTKDCSGGSAVGSEGKWKEVAPW